MPMNPGRHMFRFEREGAGVRRVGGGGQGGAEAEGARSAQFAPAPGEEHSATPPPVVAPAVPAPRRACRGAAARIGLAPHDPSWSRTRWLGVGVGVGRDRGDRRRKRVRGHGSVAAEHGRGGVRGAVHELLGEGRSRPRDGRDLRDGLDHRVDRRGGSRGGGGHHLPRGPEERVGDRRGASGPRHGWSGRGASRRCAGSKSFKVSRPSLVWRQRCRGARVFFNFPNFSQGSDAGSADATVTDSGRREAAMGNGGRRGRGRGWMRA